jgi:hypothetical protein
MLNKSGQNVQDNKNFLPLHKMAKSSGTTVMKGYK